MSRATISSRSVDTAEINFTVSSTCDRTSSCARRSKSKDNPSIVLFLLFTTSLCINHRFLVAFDEKGSILDDLDMISFKPVRPRVYNAKKGRNRKERNSLPSLTLLAL